MHGEGSTEGWGKEGTRGAHVEHVPHGCEPGRVEAQRLVERRRSLPRVERGAYAMRGEVRAGRRQGVWGSDGASGMHEEGPTEGWGPGHARSARKTCDAWS